MKFNVFISSMLILMLTHVGCVRESILDKKIHIQKKILDVPHLASWCDKIKGLEKGVAKIEQGHLYYEQEGQGIPIVLINGGPGDTHHGFHPYFSRIKKYARVIYYDQRGTGKSSRDETGKTYTINQAVKDLESLRKALNIEKWIVLGWSYGGLLAQMYVLSYPDRVAGLVLGASQLGLFDPTFTPQAREKEFISQIEDEAMNNIRQMGMNGKITAYQSIYNQLLSGKWKRAVFYKPTKEALIRNVLFGGLDTPAKFSDPMRAESYTIDYLKGRFDDCMIPTLIIEGKYDLLWWNPNRAELIRNNHPHAQFELFKKSGHGAFADEPNKFFHVLKKFIKK